MRYCYVMTKRILSRQITIKIPSKTFRVKVEIHPRRQERGVGTILSDMLASVHDSVRHIFVQIKPEYHVRTPDDSVHQIRSDIQDGYVVNRIGVQLDLCCLAE